jgi:hypothetical protein
MCYFITATMSADGDENAVRRLAQQHLLRWERITNPTVISLLRPGETYFFTTRGMCDCDTAIGSAHRDLIREPNWAREIKKLRKKGWTQQKIERWEADRRKDIERNRSMAEARQGAGSVGVQSWIDFIRSVIESSSASGIGIVLHFYAGSLNREACIRERRSVSIDELTTEFLLNVEEDILYTFSQWRTGTRTTAP